MLSQVKLIAEPWDVGPGGYQVGNFPVLWAEWNGKYRDSVRDFWRGQGNVGEFAQRFTGSSDLYAEDSRDLASINFVTAHDGFTLRDLVSYNEKHNEANLEDNRDGTDDNRSWNLGAEGPTDDPAVLALRARQQRNFLTTLLLSQGVPMLLGGDELGRTQGGNNNAWCQDNEISWFDWAEADGELLEFARRVIALRREHPVFRRTSFLTGKAGESGLPDAWWFRPDGRRMTQRDWTSPETRTLGVFLNGREIRERTPHGEPIFGDSFLLLFNAQLRAARLHAADASLRHALAGRARDGRGAGRSRSAPGPSSRWTPTPLRCFGETEPMRIYLAGSIFTPYERSFLADCAERLRGEGFDVFVPHEQGLVGLEATPEAVFAVDAGGVESADAVLAVLDGPSVDDGTACEIGLFHGLKQRDPERKGIVGLLTDLRGERRGDFAINLFVRGCIDASGGAVVGSLDEAVAILHRWRSDVVPT